jgi:hypothetical protein
MCASLGELEMREELRLSLVAVACVALLASGAVGASVFFSLAADVGNGVTPGDPNLQIQPGESGNLYIWSTDDQDYDTTIGMNVFSGTPGVIGFTGGIVYNPDIQSQLVPSLPPVPRWNNAAVGTVNADTIVQMNAANVALAMGVLAANNGTDAQQNLDLGYDVSSGAFLLASVDFDALQQGTTTLSISQDMPVQTALFVNQGERIDPEFMTATITVGSGGISLGGVALGIGEGSVPLGGGGGGDPLGVSGGVGSPLGSSTLGFGGMGLGTFPIPEPSTIILVLVGSICVGWGRKLF